MSIVAPLSNQIHIMNVDKKCGLSNPRYFSGIKSQQDKQNGNDNNNNNSSSSSNYGEKEVEITGDAVTSKVDVYNSEGDLDIGKFTHEIEICMPDVGDDIKGMQG